MDKKAKKFSRVSKGVRKIAKLKAEKNPGGGAWRVSAYKQHDALRGSKEHFQAHFRRTAG